MISELLAYDFMQRAIPVSYTHLDVYKRQAFWSGGTFIYVPKGVKVDIPLQTYFRINNEATAQFERTLIIVDEGASVHYVEGCTAVSYTHLDVYKRQ